MDIEGFSEVGTGLWGEMLISLQDEITLEYGQPAHQTHDGGRPLLETFYQQLCPAQVGFPLVCIVLGNRLDCLAEKWVYP